MENNFNVFMLQVMEYEGTTYENHPADPGGPTKFGITIYDIALRENLNAKKHWSKLTQMVKDLTKDEAYEIYKRKYWDDMLCDQLNSGVDCIICDMGINAGNSKSVKMAQKIAGTIADGKLGPKTKDAINGLDPIQFIHDFSDARRKYYKSLPDFPTFGKGWLRRVANCEVFCLGLVGDAPIRAKARRK